MRIRPQPADMASSCLILHTLAPVSQSGLFCAQRNSEYSAGKRPSRRTGRRSRLN